MTLARVIFDDMSENVVVFSHRRSGTHLTIDAIRNNFNAYRAPHVNLDTLRKTPHPEQAVERLAESWMTSARVLKSHSIVQLRTFFPRSEIGDFVQSVASDAKTIYVCRDGRDVMTSLYYYALKVKPALRDVTFSRFLRMRDPLDARPSRPDVGNVAYWKRHVTGWINQPDVFAVSFESLISEYDEQVARLASFLNQPVPSQVTRVVRTGRSNSLPDGAWARSREKLTKTFLRLIKGVDITSVDFRRGQVGSFREIFTENDLQYFDSVAGDLMAQLGYSRGGTDPSNRSISAHESA